MKDTLLWTPFLRVQRRKLPKNKKPKTDISWNHWHSDWHVVGITLEVPGFEYEIDWISDPSYFLAARKNNYWPLGTKK